MEKERIVFLTGNGQTRIHLDRVRGFPSTSVFIELEIVLRDDQTSEQGQAIAQELCQKLKIEDKDHIKCAYIDLLLNKDQP